MEENKNVESSEEEVVSTNNVEQKASEEVNSTEESAKKAEIQQKKSRKELKAEKEEARRTELANLSDDELYARIQTEKLLKSRKIRRTATLATLCVCFALALCVIIMAIVPVSYVPSCIKGTYSSVKLYKSGSTTAVATITTDDERYDTLSGLLTESFQQSYLNALFSGCLTSYDVDEKGGTSLGEYTGKDESLSLSTASSMAGDNYLIQFNFAETQVLTNQNGSTYKSVYSSGTTNNTVSFNVAYLSVSIDEDGGVTSTEIYIPGIYTSSQYTSGYSMRIFTVTVKADTSVIYSNWSTLLS